MRDGWIEDGEWVGVSRNAALGLPSWVQIVCFQLSTRDIWQCLEIVLVVLTRGGVGWGGVPLAPSG